jgi:hypothetical protein
VGILVGVRRRRQRRCWIRGYEGFRNFEEDEFAGFGLWAGAAAEIAGGDSVLDDGGDGVVGVELGARAAVGVHVREDADDGRVAVVHEDDSVFVGGHGDGADLIDLEGYVQSFVGDGFVGLGVDDFDVEGRCGLGEGRNSADR